MEAFKSVTKGNLDVIKEAPFLKKSVVEKVNQFIDDCRKDEVLRNVFLENFKKTNDPDAVLILYLTEYKQKKLGKWRQIAQDRQIEKKRQEKEDMLGVTIDEDLLFSGAYETVQAESALARQEIEKKLNQIRKLKKEIKIIEERIQLNIQPFKEFKEAREKIVHDYQVEMIQRAKDAERRGDRNTAAKCRAALNDDAYNKLRHEMRIRFIKDPKNQEYLKSKFKNNRMAPKDLSEEEVSTLLDSLQLSFLKTKAESVLNNLSDEEVQN